MQFHRFPWRSRARYPTLERKIEHFLYSGTAGAVAVIRDLTQHGRAEPAPSDGEQRLRLALEGGDLGLWDLNAITGQLIVNERWLTMLGLSAKDTAPTLELWRSLVHPADLPGFDRLVQGLIRNPTERHLEAEIRARRSDGAFIWILVKGAIVEYGEQGNALRIVGTHMDISLRKSAEAKLRASERKLRGLYALPHVGIALTDAQGRLLDFNEAYCNICGYSAEELQGLDQRKRTPTICEADEEWQALERDGHYGPYEKEYVRKDGRVICLQLNGVLLEDRDDQKLIWSIVENIGDRKYLERRLVAESLRNRLFLRTASDGVHILDSAGRVVEVSDSFCAMLGYTRDEVIGMRPTQWDAIPRTKTEVDSRLSDLMSGALKRFQTRHRRRDGTIYPVEIHAEAFNLTGLRHVFCSARDITEQRRLEQAVLDAASREQESLGRDLHDGLGQELTGISLLADAIALSERHAGRPAADELQNLAALARRAIGNCRSISHGLSPLSFADGGLVGALKEMVDLQQDIFSSATQFESILAVPLDLWPEAEDHLYRIAQEALANARRHASARLLQVTLAVQAESVRLEVRDDGIGFAPPHLTSSGMGLKIMEFRASIIGARLSIASLAEGGTRVLCECPHVARKPF
jgi:PAS domain S-box-containing protein